MNKEKMGKVLDALKMLTGHYWIADAEKALLSEAIQILQDATAQPVQPAVSDAEVKAAMEGMHFTSTGIPRVIDMRRALEEFAKSRTVAQPVQLDTKLLDYINCNYSDAKGETLMEKVIDALETMDIALGMTEVNQAQPVQPALQSAAQAVLNRWDSPQWKWKKHGTTDYLMHALRKAIAQTVQPVSNDEIEAAVFAERAACAILCEVRYMGDNTREDMEARRCATMIRARTK